MSIWDAALLGWAVGLAIGGVIGVAVTAYYANKEINKWVIICRQWRELAITQHTYEAIADVLEKQPTHPTHH